MAMAATMPHFADEYAGKTLRNLRLFHGMSQEALGEKLTVSCQQVQKYEHGLNRMTVSKIYQLARLFNVSPQIFFPDSAEQKMEDIIPPHAQKLMRAYSRLDSDRKRSVVISIICLLSGNEGFDHEQPQY